MMEVAKLAVVGLLLFMLLRLGLALELNFLFLRIFQPMSHNQPQVSQIQYPLYQCKLQQVRHQQPPSTKLTKPRRRDQHHHHRKQQPVLPTVLWLLLQLRQQLCLQYFPFHHLRQVSLKPQLQQAAQLLK